MATVKMAHFFSFDSTFSSISCFIFLILVRPGKLCTVDFLVLLVLYKDPTLNLERCHV